MKQVLTVARESLSKHLKSWGFYIMVFGPIAFVAIIALLNTYVFDSPDSSGADTTSTITLVSDVEGMAEMFAELEEAGLPFELSGEYESLEEAETAVEDGDLDGVLTVELQESGLQASLHHEGELTESIPVIQQALTQVQAQVRAGELGLNEADLAFMNEPVEVSEVDLQPASSEDEAADEAQDALQLGIAYFINIIAFIFIMFYSSMISEEIATEKGSRVMEVILSSITAGQHFFGKLLGIAFTGFVHVLIYIVAAAVGIYFFAGDETMDIMQEVLEIGQSMTSFLAISLLLVVLAIILYAVISAFLGSLVTKTEDTNRVMVPIVTIALIGFYIGIFTLGGTENTLVQISSHVPFWMPLIMPFRMAAGTVASLELTLSLIGTGLFIILVTWLSLIFYRSNVLVYASQNPFAQVKRSWSIMRSNQKAKQSK